MTLRGKTLLVSAAAGSGKTSVLTERIIRSLTDPENPADLSRMLVVTFTRAAAAELKSRIAAALTKAMAQNPGHRHLSRQLFLLSSAQISTIDSFFQRAVRANFEQLELPASFRLADESEILPISAEILGGLIEEYYQKYNVSKEEDSLFGRLRTNRFAYLMDHLMSDRSDGAAESFLLEFPKAYAAEPDGVEVLKKSADTLFRDADREFLTTSYGRALAAHLSDKFRSYLAYLAQVLEYLDTAPDLNALCRGLVESDADFCRAMLRAIEECSYARLRTVAFGFISGRFPTLRDKKTARIEAYQDWRKTFKKDITEKVQSLLATPAERIAEQMRQTAELTEILYHFYKDYNARLLAEKNERGILEYNDVRAMLYKLLANPDGSPTAFADSLASQYDAVYIDEYQDVDFLQDRIFSLIGRDRRFMVGDIKQSIYGFRGSEPSIFANYRREMPLHTHPDAENASGNCVFMSENFRCDEPVIRFANKVCSFLFSACEESVGYRPQDDLQCCKENPQMLPAGHPVPVRVEVFDSTQEQNKRADADEDPTHDEAVWVASEISRLLREGVLDNGRAVQPSDIAILVRKNKHGSAYVEELQRLGIPATSATASNILETPYLCDLLNLLRAIDNPYRDLPLSEFLLSPIGDFSLEELTDLRQAGDGSGALYDAMFSVTNHADTVSPSLFEKATQTLQWLESMRSFAASLSADRFLHKLYQTEKLLPYASTPAALFLYEQARMSQRSAFCGLYGFLNSFTKVLENGKLSIKGFTKPESAVTVMTVHNSKGLEFPVVFCSSVGAVSQNKELNAPILYHRDVGLSAKHYQAETGVREETTLRTAVRLRLEDERTEESIRTLYVALTRARERMYVTGTLRGAWDKTLSAAALIRRGDRAAILGTQSTLTWILAALSEPENADTPSPWSITHHEAGSVERGIGMACVAAAEPTPVFSPQAEHFARVLAAHKQFSYPLDALQGLPTKVAASKLQSTLLDTLTARAEDTEEALLAQIELMRAAAPSFDTLLQRSEAPSATDIGTATHAFLELCDFDALFREGIDAECERLVQEQFLSKDSARILDRTQLDAFCRSDLAELIRKASVVRREQKFATFMPMKELTEREAMAQALSDRTILVQGSIDLLLQMPDGQLCLVDYKTDRMYDGEREDLNAFRARMRSAHRDQLAAYAHAVCDLFGRFPDRIGIYSLPLSATLFFPCQEILEKDG